MLNLNTGYKMANKKSVFDIIERDEKFSVLLKVLNQSGFGNAMLREEKPFTFFAPTDGAFYRFFQNSDELSLTNAGKIMVASILRQHLIPGVTLFSHDLRQKSFLTSMEGSRVSVRHDNHRIFVNGAQILTAGMAATNGVVFAVDKVLVNGV